MSFTGNVVSFNIELCHLREMFCHLTLIMLFNVVTDVYTINKMTTSELLLTHDGESRYLFIDKCYSVRFVSYFIKYVWNMDSLCDHRCRA